MNNLDALRQAMICLKGSGLKMWLYLNKNHDNYRFALSGADCKEWGIKKDSYYDGIKDLIANGYLRQSQPGSNLYIFYENALTENPTSGYSEFYFTENTKPASGFQNVVVNHSFIDTSEAFNMLYPIRLYHFYLAAIRQQEIVELR